MLERFALNAFGSSIGSPCSEGGSLQRNKYNITALHEPAVDLPCKTLGAITTWNEEINDDSKYKAIETKT